MDVLMSIKPEYVEKIFDGSKGFEYRKVGFRTCPEKIIIYSTLPVGMVVGEASVTGYSTADIEVIWRWTGEAAGITRAEFLEYYKGYKKAIAIDINDPIKYDEPRELIDYGIARPPQNFMYLKES